MEESLYKKLVAIKTLMDNSASTAGEKQNARKLFNVLLQKNNLTENDLLSEEKELYSFKYANEFEKRLIVQIVVKVTNRGIKNYYTGDIRTGRRSKIKLWFEMTKLQSREAATLYAYYKKALAAELNKMFRAFIQANDIFPESADNDDRPELSHEELQELLKMFQLSQTINPVRIPNNYPALEAGE